MDPIASLPGLEAIQERPLRSFDLEAVARSGDPEAIRRAAEDFEAVYLAQMLEPIFATVKTDGPFSAGPSEEIYRSILIEEYGKAMARAGGIGIAEEVQRELLTIQENLSNEPSL